MRYVNKMCWGFAVFAMLTLAVPAVRAESTYARDILMATDALGDLQKQSNVVLIDAEAPATYQRGHIPGAVNLHFTQFSNIQSRRANAYPVSVEDAEKLLGGAGIGNDTFVVIYDGGDGKAASGLWFTLHFFGHEKMKVMNGGFRKWVKEGRPATQDTPKVAKKVYVAEAHPEQVVSLAWMKKNLRKKAVVVIDARSLNEYIGQVVPEGTSRGGHIPGAKNLEWGKLGGELETFKSADEIRKVLAKHGITKDTEVVTYCNTGIGRSTFLWMALQLAGYENVKEYTGSWEDWSSDPRLPIEK